MDSSHLNAFCDVAIQDMMKKYCLPLWNLYGIKEEWKEGIPFKATQELCGGRQRN